MLGFGGFLLMLLLIGFALPRESRFEISTNIDAADATVYLQIIDPSRMRLWLFDADDEARYAFEGPDRGVDAAMAWSGVSSGKLRIIEATPYTKLIARMNEGEAGDARLFFRLVEQQATTDVRLEFAHDYGLNIVGRYFGLLATGVLRTEYQQSLARLKDLAEGLPQADFGDLTINEVTVDATPVAFVAATSSPDPASISAMLGTSYAEILRFIEKNGLTPAGLPLSVAHGFVGNKRRFDVGIPVSGIDANNPPDDARVQITEFYSGPAVMVEHSGAWESLGETHRKIAAYLAAAGIERNGSPWEAYVDKQTQAVQPEMITEVYYPIRRR